MPKEKAPVDPNAPKKARAPRVDMSTVNFMVLIGSNKKVFAGTQEEAVKLIQEISAQPKKAKLTVFKKLPLKVNVAVSL